MGVFEDRLHIKFQQSYILLYYFDEKGFHFPINLCSQNLDDFRKSMHITYRLSLKAKKLEDKYKLHTTVAKDNR